MAAEMEPPSIEIVSAKLFRDEWKRRGGPKPVNVQIDALLVAIVERQTRTATNWFLSCPGCRKPRRTLIRVVGKGAACRQCLKTDLGRKPRARKRPVPRLAATDWRRLRDLLASGLDVPA